MKLRPASALAGVALGLGVAFVVLRFLPREAPPKPPGVERDAAAIGLSGAPLAEDSGAIDRVVFHYVPALEPLVFEPYRDFLGTLDQGVKIAAVVPRGATPALNAMLARIDQRGALAARVRVIEVDGPISVWSKDRALVLQAPAKNTLVVPAPPDDRWVERANDWRTVGAVASALEGFTVRELPLDFDAGDFAVTSEGTVVVDANLFAKNQRRGFADVAALAAELHSLLGARIVTLGAADGDVPRHHLSMYMTPLGDRTVLLGDPRAGRDVVGADFAPAATNPDTGAPLRADFTPAMLARYDRAEVDLKSAGFTVVRVPTVPFDDKTYLAYTNGIFESRDGKRVAWIPSFGIEALDARARTAFEALGWEVRPVSVRGVYPYHGTIGCLVNVLARRP